MGHPMRTRDTHRWKNAFVEYLRRVIGEVVGIYCYDPSRVITQDLMDECERLESRVLVRPMIRIKEIFTFLGGLCIAAALLTCIGAACAFLCPTWYGPSTTVWLVGGASLIALAYWLLGAAESDELRQNPALVIVNAKEIVEPTICRVAAVCDRVNGYRSPHGDSFGAILRMTPENMRLSHTTFFLDDSFPKLHRDVAVILTYLEGTAAHARMMANADEIFTGMFETWAASGATRSITEQVGDATVHVICRSIVGYGPAPPSEVTEILRQLDYTLAHELPFFQSRPIAALGGYRVPIPCLPTHFRYLQLRWRFARLAPEFLEQIKPEVLSSSERNHPKDLARKLAAASSDPTAYQAQFDRSASPQSYNELMYSSLSALMASGNTSTACAWMLDRLGSQPHEAAQLREIFAALDREWVTLPEPEKAKMKQELRDDLEKSFYDSAGEPKEAYLARRTEQLAQYAFLYKRTRDCEGYRLLYYYYLEWIRLACPAGTVPRFFAKRTTICHETLPSGRLEIPANSLVVTNLRAACRDPKHWRNPDAFVPLRHDPERCKELNGTEEPHKFGTYPFAPFSVGTRPCPARYAARSISLAFLRAAVKFRYIPDPTAPPFRIEDLTIARASTEHRGRIEKV